MSFHKLIEDPMYDEDGVCVDEDFEFITLEELAAEEDFYSKERDFYE
jgi:hypothetical protein